MQKKELMLCKNTSPEAFKVVLNGIKIENSTNVQLAQTFVKIFILIGLRMQHYPDKINNEFLVNYIRKNYGHKTLDELYFAFDLAIKDELNLQDSKVYDQFTIEYLVRIMNAYKIYLFKKSNELTIKKELPKTEKMNNKQKLEDIETYLVRTDLNINNLFLIPLYIFDNLIELQMLIQTDKQKAIMYKRATELYGMQLKNEAVNFERFALIKYNSFLNLKERNFIDIKQDDVDNIDNYYKKLSVLNYIKKYQQEQNS